MRPFHTKADHEAWFASKTYATIVVGFSMFVDTFYYDMTIPCLPKILERRVSTTVRDVQFWTSASLAVFGGAFLITPPFAGLWTDRCRKKRFPFLAGLVALCASNLAFFLGTTIPALMIARAFQGISAAVVWVSGFALLTAYARNGGIGAIFGYVMMSTSIGELLGPVLGGLTYDFGGHWSLCALGLSLVSIDLVLRLLLREREPDVEVRHDQEQDPLINEEEPASEYGSANIKPANRTTIIASSVDSASSSSIVEANQQLSEEPSLYYQLIRSTDFLASLYTVLMGSIIKTALESVIPIYTSSRFGFPPSVAGLTLLAFVLPNLLGAVVGGLAERHGPRLISVFACAGMSACFIALGLVPGQDLLAMVMFVGAISITGVAQCFLLTSHSVAISIHAISVSKGRKNHKENGAEGVSYALMNLAYAGGMLLGPAWAAPAINMLGWKGLCFSFSGLFAASGVLLGFAWRKWEGAG